MAHGSLRRNIKAYRRQKITELRVPVINPAVTKRLDGMTEWHHEREARACLILGLLLKDAGAQDCAAEMFYRALSFQSDLVEARVCAGFAYWQAEDLTGMYESFREAVRLDPLAARAAVLEGPEEVRLISLILYPRQYGAPTQDVDREEVIPAEVRDRDKRLTHAQGLVARGSDKEAIVELEGLLRDDPDDLHPISLLALAYLLLTSGGGSLGTADGRGSVLWEVEPGLARLLFRS